MEIVFVLLPLTLLLAIAAVAGFIWAVRRGQLDDLDTPAHRMLVDDPPTGRAESGAADDESAKR
jgi:cbb3-type cytochrome oxidase maturation protein